MPGAGGVGWFPDGRRVLVDGQQAGHERRTYVRGHGGRHVTIPDAGRDHAAAQCRPTAGKPRCRGPGGKTLIYPVAGGAPRPVRGLEPEEAVGDWSADGRSLIVARWEKTPVRVFLVDLATGSRQSVAGVPARRHGGRPDRGPVVFTTTSRDTSYRYRRALSDLYLVDGLR